MRPTEFTIFSGTANPALARVIGHELGTRVGNCVLDRYPDGEVAVQILESVRRKEVFLMQPTSPPAKRAPDRSAPGGGCKPPRRSDTHHGDRAVFRLRTCGQAAWGAGADHGANGRRSSGSRWDRPRRHR